MIISASKFLCRCQKIFAFIPTNFWPLKYFVTAVGSFVYSLKIFDIPGIRFLLQLALQNGPMILTPAWRH